MTEQFKQVCNNNSDEFNAIVNALNLPRNVRRDNVLRFLSFVDSIIDYYLLKIPEHGVIRYPIVFIPCAKTWAERICLEYVAYKIQATFDGGRRKQLQGEFENPIVVPNGAPKNYVRRERYFRNTIRPILEGYNEDLAIRNLIVCGNVAYRGIIRNSILKRFYGETPLTSIDCCDVVNAECRYADFPEIENIFIFYSNNDECNSYEINSLGQWGSLKNCFIFEFDTTPYSLNNILRRGRRLGNCFLHNHIFSQDNTESRYEDFITLTEEEAHYLFDEECPKAHIVVSPPIDDKEKADFIEFYKGEEEWRFSIKDRNILSLCLCKEIRETYLNYLKETKPQLFADEWWSATLNIILDNIQTLNIKDRVTEFVGDERGRVAFVMSNGTQVFQQPLRHLFRPLQLSFYQYKDLQNNNIRETKIVVLRFMPHNLSSRYYTPRFPNSFDGYSLRANQTILDIINEVAFLDYEKYKYDYEVCLRAATTSCYRNAKLGGQLNLVRPDIQIITSYNDFDDDECDRPQPNVISVVNFEFADGANERWPESEFLICKKNDGEMFIENIRNISESCGFGEISAIQPISELADSTMDVFFKEVRNTSSKMEDELRKSYVEGGIIPLDHNQEVPIWKFLLERKIRDYCIQHRIIEDAANGSLWELLENQMEHDCLQNLRSEIGVSVSLRCILKSWCDTSSAEPLAPGRKKDRVQLITQYLRLNQGVSTLYHRKQKLTKNMTRKRNNITESFLCEILFNEISDDLATKLLEDPQYADYLTIDSKEDIETLKNIAKENIKLRTINSIKHDRN